jgi:hypothetical protein
MWDRLPGAGPIHDLREGELPSRIHRRPPGDLRCVGADLRACLPSAPRPDIQCGGVCCVISGYYLLRTVQYSRHCSALFAPCALRRTAERVSRAVMHCRGTRSDGCRASRE